MPYQQMLSYNSFLKKKFGLHGKDNSTLTLYEPTRAITTPKGGMLPSFSGLGKTVTPTVLHKKVIYSNPTTQAKLSVINQDGKYQTTVYVTTPEKIKIALRNGVFEASTIQDPLAKMIAEIGVYKRTVFERSTELHVKVTKNEERLAVADITQTLIEALQPLNQCINNYNASKTPQENLQGVLQRLNQLGENLTHLISENEAKKEEPYPTLMACAAKVKNQIEEYRNALAKIKNPSEDQVKTILGSFGTSDNLLKYFLQQQINTITQAGIDANYAVTGLYQDGSGLSQALLNAQFTGEKFSSQLVDYHNSVSKEHGFDFSDKAKNGLVAIDLGDYGFHPKSSVELAKRVALINQIEEGKKLNHETDETVRLINFRSEKDAFPGYTAVKKAGFTLVNFGIDISTFVLDLGYSAYASATGIINVGIRAFGGKPFKVGPFPSERSFFQKWDIAENAYANLDSTRVLFGENAITQVTNSGIFVKAFKFIGQQLINFTWKPLVEVVKGLTTNLWDGAKNIYYDVTIGRKPISDNEIAHLLNSRHHANAEIEQENHRAIEMLLDMQKEGGAYKGVEFDNIGEASADYQLNPDKPEDFVSWASNDFVKGMVEVFSQEIYRAHPLGGLAFTVAATTATPMIMPFAAKYAFLHFIYTKIDIPIAKALVGETHGFMSAFSTAMIEGKAAFLLSDMTNGKDSILVRGVELVFENPVLAGLIGTAAIGLGFEIAFKANIPWLSEEIASEAAHASFPYFELGLSGAKLAAIVLESGIRYEAEEEESHAHELERKIEDLRPEVREAMMTGYKKEKGVDQLSPEQEKQVDAQVSEYLDAFKKALDADYTDVMLHAIEKSIGEYAVRHTESPSSKQQETVSKLQTNFKRAHIREQILELEADSLPQDERYKIMHYVNTHYADDPEYVAAVKYKFMGGHEKIGGLAGSIKMALSYIPALARAGVSAIMSGGLKVASLFDPSLTSQASMAFQPVRDLVDKVRADTGLIIKAVSNMARVGWGLIGSILRVPVVALYTLLTSPALIGQHLAGSHIIPTPLEVNSKLSTFLFAPGKISQFLNAVTGFFRAAASAKNIEVATDSITKRETSENIAHMQPLIAKKIEGKEASDKIMLKLLAPSATEEHKSANNSASPSKSHSHEPLSKAGLRILVREDVTHKDHPLKIKEDDSREDEGEGSSIQLK